MEPKWIEVQGEFYPRGGIGINPSVKIIKQDATGQEGK